MKVAPLAESDHWRGITPWSRLGESNPGPTHYEGHPDHMRLAETQFLTRRDALDGARHWLVNSISADAVRTSPSSLAAFVAAAPAAT